jgi:hypothetical protein
VNGFPCEFIARGMVAPQTTRYFVDKFPLFLSGSSIGPAPVVTFCYVDGNLGKPAGFDTHLLEDRELFARLESVQMVYVSTTKGRSRRRNASFGASRDAGSKICEGAVGSRSGSLTRALPRSRSPRRAGDRVFRSLTDRGMSCGSSEAQNTRNFIRHGGSTETGPCFVECNV